MPPLNPTFQECLAKFSALYGSYYIIYGSEQSVDLAMSGIMKDAKKSFTDIADSLGDLGGALSSDINSFVSEFSDIGSDIKNQLTDLIKDPFSNIGKIIKGQLDSETLQKISQFFDEQGIKATALSTTHFMALITMSALKGVATIGVQRKLLSQLEQQVNSVMNRIYDTPSVNPPIHPFQDTMYHLQKAKEDLQSVGSQLIRRGSVDYIRYDEGVAEMKNAKDGLAAGRLSQAFLNQAGLGNFVQLKNNDGQTKPVPIDGLKAYHFLPPIHLGVNLIVIKNIRNQLAVYNANLASVDNTIRSVTQNLYLAMDVGRFLGSLVQFLVFEVTSTQKSMEKASTKPVIGPDSLSIQAETYARMLADIFLAEKLRVAFNRFNAKDVNDFPALKGFRQKLKELDTSKCSQVYASLDASIAGFVNAYQRRSAGRATALTVKYAGQVVKGLIKQQREYLDCIEGCLGTITGPKIDPRTMNAIAGVGAALALLQGLDIDSLLNKQFNFKAFLLSQIKTQVDCMMKSCANPGVHGLLTRLMDEIVVQQRVISLGFGLTKNFSIQARFSSKYENGQFAQMLQQFINTVQRLSC
jgi:hypothetical protein